MWSYTQDALVQIGSPVVEPLIAALKGQDHNVSRDAAEALGRIGDIRAAEPLIATLEDSRVCSAAARALGKIGDPCAVVPLIAVLSNEEKSIRNSAIEALGQIADPRAIEPLIATLRRNRDTCSEARKALVQIGSPAVEPLIAELESDHELVRSDAIRTLATIGDARAAEPLISALGDASRHVRWETVNALRKLGDSRAVQPLSKMLNDSDQQVQEAAQRALQEIGGQQAEAALAAKDVQDGYVDDDEFAIYWLSETSLGNPLKLEVITEKYCVYCRHLKDPNLRDPGYPNGVGECSNYESDRDVVSLKQSC